MTAAQYQEIREEFRHVVTYAWNELPGLAKLRLKRKNPEWLRAKLAAVVLTQDRPAILEIWPLFVESHPDDVCPVCNGQLEFSDDLPPRFRDYYLCSGCDGEGTRSAWAAKRLKG